MLILSPKDLFTVKRMSLIADYDKETLFNLYQPLVGAVAASLYMSLLCEAKNQKVFSIANHEQLLVRMQITTQDFLSARANLEAVGLIKTYLDNPKADIKLYHYEVYAPKTPKSFFDNALLYGMLIKYVGEADASRLKKLYNEDSVDTNGTEISKSFGEVYRPDLEDPVFKKALSAGSNRGRRAAKIDYEFNYDRFFETLETSYQIRKTALSKQELKEVERLAALYGVDEISAANVVSTLYDYNKEKGYRIDFTELSNRFRNETAYSFLSNISQKRKTGKNKLTSDSDLATKINLMESLSPKEYLSILQNGSTPASSDLRLIDDISKNFALTPGVINALIDFVLATKDNTFPKSYAEKVAASLAREGITSVLDAMNYLKKVKNGSKKGTYVAPKKDNIQETTIEPVKSSGDEEDDVSWDELINKLQGDEK